MQLETGIVFKRQWITEAIRQKIWGSLLGQHSILTTCKATGHAHVLLYTSTHPSQVLTSDQGVEFVNKLNVEVRNS